MPNTYQYYNQGGQLQQVQANTPAEALANAQNRASDSGVQLVSSGQSSPTVVSNENKIKEVPKLNASLGKYSQKGITSDPNSGLSTYADGSAYNPQDFVDADTTDEDKQINDFIEQQKASLDASTKSLIDNIQQKFAQRKAEQAEINRRQEKGVQNALLMGGTTGQGSSAQFAPISSGGIVQAQESYGLKQIADLDAQEQDLIAEAKAAQESGNFELLGKKMSMVEEKRNEKIKAAAKLNEKIAEQNAKLREESVQSQKDNAIADLYSQGITSTTEILKKLNEEGANLTAKDVATTLKHIAENVGADDYKTLDKDTQEFYRLKKESGGLPTSILHLPSTGEQLFAYLKLKNQATAKSGTGASGVSGGGTSGAYGSDLDAIIGNTLATIPTKFGQETFKQQIAKARNDADKISTIAAVVLKGQPAETKRDFTNQSIAVKNLDKALKIIDEGAKSGVLNNAKQYTYNVAGKDFDPKLAAINAYITSAIQPYRNSITGAAWGDQEEAEYQSLFGSTKYSPKELKERLVRIKEIMKDRSLTALNAYVNPIDTYGNVFESTGNTPTIGGSSFQDMLNTPLPGAGQYNPNVW